VISTTVVNLGLFLFFGLLFGLFFDLFVELLEVTGNTLAAKDSHPLVSGSLMGLLGLRANII
jgi:hypothetical protein